MKQKSSSFASLIYKMPFSAWKRKFPWNQVKKVSDAVRVVWGFPVNAGDFLCGDILLSYFPEANDDQIYHMCQYINSLENICNLQFYLSPTLREH